MVERELSVFDTSSRSRKTVDTIQRELECVFVREYEQCDQMARLFVLYLSIYKN